MVFIFSVAIWFPDDATISQPFALRFPTPRRTDQNKGIFVVKCVGGQKIGFFYGTLQNPNSYGVDIWVQGDPLPSPIYVIGHQGLTRDACKDNQDSLDDGYKWADPGE